MVQRVRERIIHSKWQQRGERGSNGVLIEQENRRILHPADLIFKCGI
jgi:hypothetical protein